MKSCYLVFKVFTALAGGLIAMSVGSSIALSSSLIPQVIDNADYFEDHGLIIIIIISTAEWCS